MALAEEISDNHQCDLQSESSYNKLHNDSCDESRSKIPELLIQITCLQVVWVRRLSPQCMPLRVVVN